MFNITPLAQQFAPWSISKAGVAETCAAQFAHKYIHKTPEQAIPSDNKVGTAAHSVLEERVGGKSVEEAKKIALEKTPLTSNEMDTLRSLETNMEQFLRRFDQFCRSNGVTQVLREVEWGITSDFKPTGFFAKDVYFRGKVDLGAITRDNDLVVIDHKSGVAKDISRDVKKKQQLYSYAVLALPNIEGLQGVRGGLHFLQGAEDKRTQWLDYMDAARIRQLYVPWLYGHLNDVAASLVAPFEAKPKLRWPCEWCSLPPRVPGVSGDGVRGSEV